MCTYCSYCCVCVGSLRMRSEREQLEVAYLDLQEKCRPFQVWIVYVHYVCMSLCHEVRVCVCVCMCVCIYGVCVCVLCRTSWKG